MTSWKTYRAEDYCLTVTDGTHDSPKPQAEGRYLITSKHLKPSGIDFSSANKICEEDYQKIIQRSKVEQYDILFSMIGTIGNIHRVTIPIVDFAVKNMGIFKMGGDANKSLWMYYWLQSPIAQEYIQSRITGSTQGYLTLGNLRDFPVCVPSLEEQRRIAGILGAIDDKIEKNRRINTNLELQAQALYKQWFVDNRNDDWETLMLEDVATLSAGGDKPQICSEQKTPECNIPIYSNGIDNEGLYGYTNNPRITEDSITISARGTIGFVSLRTEPYVPIVRLISVVPTYKNVSAYFLYLWALTQNISGTGTTQQQLTVPAFRTTKIVVPSQETLIKFNQVVNPIFDNIKQNKKENETLATLRDTLLPKLMNGEIKIRE